MELPVEHLCRCLVAHGLQFIACFLAGWGSLSAQWGRVSSYLVGLDHEPFRAVV